MMVPALYNASVSPKVAQFPASLRNESLTGIVIFDVVADFERIVTIRGDLRGVTLLAGVAITGMLRPGSRPIANFQGATFYCHNIISEHHKALKQIAKNCLMFA